MKVQLLELIILLLFPQMHLLRIFGPPSCLNITNKGSNGLDFVQNSNLVRETKRAYKVCNSNLSVVSSLSSPTILSSRPLIDLKWRMKAVCVVWASVTQLPKLRYSGGEEVFLDSQTDILVNSDCVPPLLGTFLNQN